MAKLQLTFASALYDRMQPIYTGEVQPEGIDLNFIRIEQPRPIFDRMSGAQEFDVAEYSSSEYVQRYANNQCPFVAIPIFPSRCFRHSFIGINKKSGIQKPKDLEGKRIGVALYTMTAAIFIRGILQHDYGVDFSNCTWVQGAINEKGSHGSPTVLPLLKPVKLEQGPPNKSLDEKYPFVATSLFNAFERAKEIALTRMYNQRALRYMMPWLPRDIDEIYEFFDGDPWPYGVEENRPTLEALVQYLQDQHLIAKKPTLEELFAPIYGLE